MWKSSVQACRKCGIDFAPRDWRQDYCDPCHTPCPDCGGGKDIRAARCRNCFGKHREGVPISWTRRAPLPIEEVIICVEDIGTQLGKQFAFGYVIGVAFGDGCITRVSETVRHKCKSGAVSHHQILRYRFCLQVTSQEFAEAFARKWTLLTGRPAKARTYTRTNFASSTLKGHTPKPILLHIVSCGHILFTRYLHNLKYTIGPSGLVKFPREVKLGIICGLIDSEGYVSGKYLDLANSDIGLLQSAQAIFADIGYSTRIYRSKSQRIAHLRLPLA